MNQIERQQQGQKSNNYHKIVFSLLQKKLIQNLDFRKKLYELAQFTKFYAQINLQSIENINFSEIFNLIIGIQKMSSLANEVYKITFSNSRQLISKIYHNFLQEFTSKKLEQMIVKTMSQQKQYPQVFLSDDDCRFQGFIQGKPIDYNELNEQILQKIILKLANFQKKCCTILKITNESNLSPKRSVSNLFQIFKTIYQIKKKQCSQTIQKSKVFIEQVLSQQVFLKIQKNQLPIFIASHNDSNLSNILLTKDSQDIVLIDFQFSDLNYIGFDIGNFFNELTTDYIKQFQIREQLELSFQVKQKLTYIYFSSLTLTPQQQTLLQKSKERLNQIVDYGRMMSHLYWMFVGLKQINDPNIQLDMNYYIRRRSQQFFKFYAKLK